MSDHKQQDVLSLWRTRSQVRWFLQEQGKLDHLIETLSDNIGALIEVLPHLKPAQESLAQEEAKKLVEDVQNDPTADASVLARPWLRIAISSVDEALGVELLQETVSNHGTSTTDAVATVPVSDDADPEAAVHAEKTPRGNASTVHQGHIYFGNQASGNANVIYGDTYGGKYFLDD